MDREGTDTPKGAGTGLGVRLLAFFGIFTLIQAAAALTVPESLWVGAAVTLVAAWVAGAVLVRHEGRSVATLGFYLRKQGALESAGGLLLGTAVAVAAMLVLVVAGGIRWTGEAGDPGAWLAGAAGALAFFAVPAAAEEALFRGYPMQAIARARSPSIALWAMAGVFAAAHAWNPGITALGALNLLAAGLLLGAVYLKTGSLWWATGAHLGWNWALGFLADLPVSGLDLMDAPYVVATASGPTWLSGGPFGPEGSALTAGVLLASTALLWNGPWLVPSGAARDARAYVVGFDAGGAS